MNVTSELLDFEALERAVVLNDPCPHLVVKNFVSNENLKRLALVKPDIRHGGSFLARSARLSPPYRRLLAELGSVEMKRLLGAKFGKDFSAFPTYATVRGRTREKDGAIHLDSEEKEVTILLYLGDGVRTDRWTHEGGNLRFYRDAPVFEDVASEVVPDPGTLAVFPKSPHAWHGHTPYCGDRLSIQVNYLRSKRDVTYNYARHYLSGLLKKRFF